MSSNRKDIQFNDCTRLERTRISPGPICSSLAQRKCCQNHHSGHKAVAFRGSNCVDSFVCASWPLAPRQRPTQRVPHCSAGVKRGLPFQAPPHLSDSKAGICPTQISLPRCEFSPCLHGLAKRGTTPLSRWHHQRRSHKRFPFYLWICQNSSSPALSPSFDERDDLPLFRACVSSLSRAYIHLGMLT